jgi:uncharacterized surface anchored protein
MSLTARALLVFIALMSAAAAFAGNVTGTVTDAATSLRLGGMIVAAYDATGTLRGTATTDATGLYVLSLANGDYRVLAYDPNGNYATQFDTNAESFETSPLRNVGNSGLQLNFALLRGGTISGRVQNPNGTPRADATVEVYNLSGTRRAFTTTNANGDYTVVLPPGDYKVVAFDQFSGAQFYRDAVAFAAAQPVRVTQSVTTANIFFTLVAAARATGIVIDAATQTPIGGIDVYAYTPAGAQVARTTTAANGTFALTLPAGQFRLVAADPVRVFATSYYNGANSFARAETLGFTAGQQRANLQFTLMRGALLRGRVNGANLTVAAYNLDGTLHASTTSEADGTYTLVVAPGEYKLAISDPTLTYATRFYGDVSDFRSATRLLVASDMSNVDVTLPRGGRVAGTVRDAANAQPLAGITVAAYDAAGVLISSAVTGADGRYTLVVAPGPYRVLAFDPQLNFVTAYAGGATSYETTVPVNVNVDTTFTVDLSLRRGTRVSGRIAQQNGSGIAGVDVFALDASGNRVAGGTSSSDGAFTIVLPPGSYRFVAIDPQSRYARTEYPNSVTVTAASPAPVEITLQGLVRRRAVRH